LPTVLTPTEAAALLRTANPRSRTGQRDRCLMQLMLHAGLRAAEVLALTVYDVEWLSGQLTVRQGKGKKDRILWLNEPVLEEVRRWRARRPVQAQRLLFTTLKGTPIHASALRAMVKRRSGTAGLTKDVHPHLLRHPFATERYRQTTNMRLVQKALGHSDLSTTMIYTHIVDADLATALKGFHLG
jgi:integrase/recombinase XerD